MIKKFAVVATASFVSGTFFGLLASYYIRNELPAVVAEKLEKAYPMKTRRYPNTYRTSNYSK